MADDAAGWGSFSGLNAAYLADQYEQYLADAHSVDPETRAFFERWGAPPRANGPGGDARPWSTRVGLDGPDVTRVAGAVELATAIRDLRLPRRAPRPVGQRAAGGFGPALRDARRPGGRPGGAARLDRRGPGGGDGGERAGGDPPAAGDLPVGHRLRVRARHQRRRAGLAPFRGGGRPLLPAPRSDRRAQACSTG